MLAGSFSRDKAQRRWAMVARKFRVVLNGRKPTVINQPRRRPRQGAHEPCPNFRDGKASTLRSCVRSCAPGAQAVWWRGRRSVAVGRQERVSRSRSSAAELLELGEHRIDVELVARLLLGSASGSRGRIVVSEAGSSVAPCAAASTGFSLAARCTSRSRSICEHRPSVTGSIGCRFCAFQWVRSRIAWMVDLVVPTSRMIWASLSSGWLRTSQRMAFGRSWRRETGV